MKQRLKIILLLLFAGSMLLLQSCEKDLFEDHIYQSKINTQKVSLNDAFLKQNSKLMKAVAQVKSKNRSIQDKIVYDSINHFYIDEENGISLFYNGKTSYAFRVLRDNTTESSKIENIVFKENDTGAYDSYLLKYGFTKQELEMITSLQSQNINYDIEQVAVLISSRLTAPRCRTIRVSKCSGVPWDCGGGICGYDYIIQCDEGSAGVLDNTQLGDATSIGINTVPTWGSGNTPPNPCDLLVSKIVKTMHFSAFCF